SRPAHDAPAHHAANGGKQQQVTRPETTEKFLAQREDNDLRHHAERPQVAYRRSRVARPLPVDGAEAVIGRMCPLEQTDAGQETPALRPQRAPGGPAGALLMAAFALRHYRRT